jgi:3-deoxy-manno-octulosonate cytidylyltransferase (CMP-KDO synthetase)
MVPLPTCVGIIPCRYGSTRFPGKPLADIDGRPMFWHVYTRARRCPDLQWVAVATDDPRIYAAAEELDVPVVMTRPDHPSGTDRVLEAARSRRVGAQSIVINIQGDEPALNPALLTELLQPFRSDAVAVTTAVHRISAEEAENPDRAKVVFSAAGRALYFSRAVIPHYRDGHPKGYYAHIGIYAYRMRALERFVALAPSSLEEAEKLEQLRLLENDIPIHIVVTGHMSIGVDRPEDLERVRAILQQQ